jgi:hypothetical protein
LPVFEVPVLSVIAPRQVAQTARPVSRIGPQCRRTLSGLHSWHRFRSSFLTGHTRSPSHVAFTLCRDGCAACTVLQVALVMSSQLSLRQFRSPSFSDDLANTCLIGPHRSGALTPDIVLLSCAEIRMMQYPGCHEGALRCDVLDESRGRVPKHVKTEFFAAALDEGLDHH